MTDTGDRAPDVVARIVSTALGTSVRSCRWPAVGSVANTYVLELDGAPDRVVCKLGSASVWTDDIVEPAVCRLVGERTTLSVPEVLASGRLDDGADDRERRRTAGRDDPLSRWALYGFVDGETPEWWAEPGNRARRRRLTAEAGSVLGRLHAWSSAELPFDRTGALERAPDRPTGLRVCEPTPPSVVEARSGVVGRRPAARPVLCHGDFHPDNLLVSPEGTITAVLDWGNAHVAPAEYAVARVEARFVDRFRSIPATERSRLKRSIRTRYRDHAPLEAGYANRAPLYKGLWVVQSACNLATVARSPRGQTQLRRQLRTVVDW
jgi:hypothetical protein